MIKKIRNFKFIIHNCNRGMTYVELIVVLSIFSVLSSVAIYNYGDFQTNVDIKNLTNDIALKIVDAQKLAINGVLPISGGYDENTWNPTYGISFDVTTPKQFISFVDINNDNTYIPKEIIDTFNITKNNTIGSLSVVYQEGKGATCLNDLNIIFSRPSSSAILFSGGNVLSGVSYVEIDIFSLKSKTSNIKIYPSGRIQTNTSSVLTQKCDYGVLIETDPIIPGPIIPPSDEKF